jgi:hypothetical protein
VFIGDPIHIESPYTELSDFKESKWKNNYLQ